MPRRSAPDTLTSRQIEYLMLAADGHSQAQIASRMRVNERTAGWHRDGLLRSLGARSTAQAVHIAHQRGLFGAPAKTPAARPGHNGRPCVPAGPTLAAVEEMLAAGWPLDRQATEAGVTAWSMSQLPRRTVVEAATEAKIVALAARLRGVDPLGCGVSARSAARARNQAVRRRLGAAA